MIIREVSLQLPDDLAEKLEILAQKTGRSKSFYILEAVREHLDDLEDIYLAEQRLCDLKAGRAKILSSDEVETMLPVQS